MQLITTMGITYKNLTIGNKYSVISREKHYITILDNNGAEIELPQWMLA